MNLLTLIAAAALAAPVQDGITDYCRALMPLQITHEFVGLKCKLTEGGWEVVNQIARKEGAVLRVSEWFDVPENRRLVYYVAARGWRPVEKSDEAYAADLLRERPHLRGALHFYVDGDTYLDIQKAKQGALIELARKLEESLKRF